MENKSEKILIITGPSGSGKSTLCDKFTSKNPKFKRIVTYTTRNKRGGEIDGMDYHFIPKEEFDSKIEDGFFYEYSTVYGKSYGTSKSSLDPRYNQYDKVIISNPEGALKLMDKIPRSNYVTVFIDASFPEIIKQRLDKRKSDSKAEIDNRISSFDEDYKYIDKFDYRIVNEDLEKALEQLEEIAKSNFPESVEYPVCINFFGGPGVGKSTSASGMFYHLKMKGYSCEYVSEYAKDLTWQKNYNMLKNQFYVSAVQHQRMFQLVGSVDIIITDSPILTGLLYCPKSMYPFLEPLLMNEFHKYKNINILLSRKFEFVAEGRYQKTVEEAIEVDNMLTALTERHGLECMKFDYPLEKNIDRILELVEKKMEA